MKPLAIVTDSNSGITQAHAKELGIYVIPMPFYIDNKLYFEETSLTRNEFYRLLVDNTPISTSQPAIGDVMDLFDGLLKEYDEIIYIPMSSSLSSSCETALTLVDNYNTRLQVVDNRRISVTLLQSAIDAITLSKEGKKAAEIKRILEEKSLNASIYITLDTLQFLKKGGRITPAAATIGTMLNIKPVLQIQGGKLDTFSKVRGKNHAKKIMLSAAQKDIETRFANNKENKKLKIFAVYSDNDAEGKRWQEEIQSYFPDFEIELYPLSLSIACHIGHGALAIALCEEI